MFRFLLVACVLLPIVLGRCCSPDTYSMVSAATGRTPTNVVVDFNQNKFFVKPIGVDSKTDFELIDFTSRKHYVKKRDKTCTYFIDNALPSPHCIPDNAPLVTSGTFGGVNGIDVMAYQLPSLVGQRILTVTKDRCIPVVSQVIIGQHYVHTTLYSNVTVPAPDLSVFDQDLDACAEDKDMFNGRL